MIITDVKKKDLFANDFLDLRDIAIFYRLKERIFFFLFGEERAFPGNVCGGI